jgi:hypothetical protein
MICEINGHSISNHFVAIRNVLIFKNKIIGEGLDSGALSN